MPSWFTPLVQVVQILASISQEVKRFVVARVPVVAIVAMVLMVSFAHSHSPPRRRGRASSIGRNGGTSRGRRNPERFRRRALYATRAGRDRAALLDRFLDDPSVEFLPAGRPESVKYAQIFRYLKSRGTPIPLHDIWIAAAALVRDVPLASFDGHFARIPLLLLVDCTP